MTTRRTQMPLKKNSDPHSGKTVIRTLLPYALIYKNRLLLAMLLLTLAKLAVLALPVTFKLIIDYFYSKPSQSTLLMAPLSLILSYGVLRMAVNILIDLSDTLFERCKRSVARTIASKTFQHLHELGQNFHLNRRGGGIAREIQLGMNAIEKLMSRSLMSILPILIELTLVLAYLAWHYRLLFASLIFGSLLAYISFTIFITNWRTKYKRQLNELDTQAAACAADSFVNFETVKYFNNELHERHRYDAILEKKEYAAGLVSHSYKLLKTGQQLIVAAAITLVLWHAASDVARHALSLGDFVLINTFLIQLYLPLNSFGLVYREFTQSLIDLERMFQILNTEPEVVDRASAPSLQCRGGEVVFKSVDFSYQADGRKILHQLDFKIPAAHTVAIVGRSGTGKSTLAKLLFRFYDIQGGQILIDGQDIRAVTQASLRKVIAIVPQDTVLFNDTIAHNIGYAKIGANQQEIEAAARSAHVHEFIMSLPQAYQTVVGERGLKLSGGEKQRIAIARAFLKNPEILIFDEATSSLDSRTEQAIQSELRHLAESKTTLIIAHRLSTVIHAHQILVMEHGHIVERGTHAELLAHGRIYPALWFAQQNGHHADHGSLEMHGDTTS